MSTDVDVSGFREHLTIDQCKQLLHHSHWIPINRGYTARFVAENYPGWTWNELVKVFVAAGIFINRGGTPATCDPRVVAFHFSSPTEFLVEWGDGVEPADVMAKRLAHDRRVGQYMVEVDEGAGITSLGGWAPK